MLALRALLYNNVHKPKTQVFKNIVQRQIFNCKKTVEREISNCKMTEEPTMATPEEAAQNECIQAQGQSLEKCGIDLNTDCFSHGQLYVACSRVGKPDNLFICSDNWTAKNVVYSQVLRS